MLKYRVGELNISGQAVAIGRQWDRAALSRNQYYREK